MTTITYWISGLIYLLIDYTQFPKFLMKYKVQPGKNEPPDTKKVLKALALVFFNQLMGIPAAMLVYSNNLVSTLPTSFVTTAPLS